MAFLNVKKRRKTVALLGGIVCLTVILSLMVYRVSMAAGKDTHISEVNDVQKILAQLPGGDVWLNHLKYDLLPFWTKTAAFGTPEGNFPTYRNNDGSALNPKRPSPELYGRNTDSDYVRMKSRQIYAYGVAYHLTGDEKYLSYAKAGIDYLRNNAFFQAENGSKGVYTYFTKSTKAWGPDESRINSQDLSYALNGLSFYYYLTRDAAVLDDIVSVKDYIFSKYYDRNTGILSWYPLHSDMVHTKELVATLDQINAYMINLTPILPEEYKGRKLQQEWKNDLEKMASGIIREYYSTDNNLFWGTGDHMLGTRHVDYGHSIKTFWMIYQIGKLTDNKELVTFVRQNAPALLERAYIPQTGSWASRPGDNGKEWWIYAELDQMAAALSLDNPDYAKYLVNTYNFWLQYMVDHTDKEIWPGVGANGEHSAYALKQSEWKNGFHSFEHALVGYITAQQLKGREVVLHFAFEGTPDINRIRPYVFDGAVKSIESEGRHVIVTFQDIN